eukprot:771732_1
MDYTYYSYKFPFNSNTTSTIQNFNFAIDKTANISFNINNTLRSTHISSEVKIFSQIKHDLCSIVDEKYRNMLHYNKIKDEQCSQPNIIWTDTVQCKYKFSCNNHHNLYQNETIKLLNNTLVIIIGNSMERRLHSSLQHIITDNYTKWKDSGKRGFSEFSYMNNNQNVNTIIVKHQTFNLQHEYAIFSELLHPQQTQKGWQRVIEYAQNKRFQHIVIFVGTSVTNIKKFFEYPNNTRMFQQNSGSNEIRQYQQLFVAS